MLSLLTFDNKIYEQFNQSAKFVTNLFLLILQQHQFDYNQQPVDNI